MCDAAVAALRQNLHGPLMARGESGFDTDCQIYNSAITTRPAMIAHVADTDDVATALALADEYALDLAVRSGGHSVAGSSLVDDGLVLDLRRINHVHVDPAAHTITAGGGAVWGEVDAACAQYGLATTGGRVSSTGVAGMTLGGGSGWLERTFGLASDNLLAAEIIIADGTRMRASREHNPELFWALHGGGGNFGVVTELTLRAYPLPEFSATVLLWPAAHGPTVARAYRDRIATAPDALGGGLLFMGAPATDFVPTELRGQLCCAVLATYTGPLSELREQLAPLLALDPAGQLLDDMDYPMLQQLLDDGPGYRHHWSGEYLNELSDDAIDLFCAHAAAMPSELLSRQLLVPWGGAVVRSSGGAMAGTDTAWVLHPLGQWSDSADDETGRAWARELTALLRPWSTGATYLNFIPDEGHERVVTSFGPANYQRLANLKAQLDPTNKFNRWHNVRPEDARDD